MNKPRENRITKRRPKLGVYTKGETYLAKQLRAYGIDPPTWQPIGFNCLVWRFPALDMSSGYGSNGRDGASIIIPEDARSPHSKGLLVAAGPQAMDYLDSHHLKLGDEVVFTKYGGDEGNDSTRTRELGQRFLTIKDKDILGSVELKNDLEKGKVRYVLKDGKRHIDRPAALPPISDKKAKVLALAGGGSTSAERATAKRIAAKMK